MTLGLSKDTVAVVTGGNTGLGYEIVRQLAQHGVTTVLTSRDIGKGEAAQAALKAEGLDTVVFHQLDVWSSASIETFADWLRKEFNGIDILVNNAGLASEKADDVVPVFETNFYGTKKVTEALLPIMKPSPNGARIIFVSSEAGLLRCLKDGPWKDKVKEENQTPATLDCLAKEYVDGVQTGLITEASIQSTFMEFLEDLDPITQKFKTAGHAWAPYVPMYSESKALLNAYALQLAKSVSSRAVGEKIFVNCATPGFTKTNMTGHRDYARSTEEGAETIVWLALLAVEDYPHGKFFWDREEMSF